MPNPSKEFLEFEGLKKIFKVFNQLKKEKVINGYGVVGAIGAMFYTQSFQTNDADIFILMTGTNYAPVFHRLESLGYDTTIKGTHLMMEGVLVDIFAPSDPLSQEALKSVQTFNFGARTEVCVVRPEYLIAMAYDIGRHKDLARAEMIISQTDIDRKLLNDILRRHKVKRP